MICWRCLVYTLLFLFGLLVLSFAEMADSAPLDKSMQGDPRAKVFLQCVDRLQLDIDLGLKPDMTDERALQICSERTEGVMNSMRERGLKVEPDYPGGLSL